MVRTATSLQPTFPDPNLDQLNSNLIEFGSCSDPIGGDLGAPNLGLPPPVAVSLPLLIFSGLESTLACRGTLILTACPFCFGIKSIPPLRLPPQDFRLF